METDKTLIKISSIEKFRDQVKALRERLQISHKELDDIINIGITLSSTKNVVTIFKMILETGKEFTGADGGSIYQVVNVNGEDKLKFVLSALDVGDDAAVMDISPSRISGFVAISQEPLILKDAYQIPEDAPYSFTTDYDRAHHYESHSMLLVPLVGYDRKTLGVIQLINKKRQCHDVLKTHEDFRDKVISFEDNDMRLVRALAGMAVIVLENRKLLDDIRHLFDGFVKASISAVEQRDPATSGHSERVARYVFNMAEAMNRIGQRSRTPRPFAPEELRELRYASLLHDFGKVGVSENVLTKPEKLPIIEMIKIENTVACLKLQLRLNGESQKCRFLLAQGRGAAYDSFAVEQDTAVSAALETIDAFLTQVKNLNKPNITHNDIGEKLRELKHQNAVFVQKYDVTILTSEHIALLAISRGSLSEKEMDQVRSHVTHSYNFLVQIPWTEDLKRLPAIAYGHHEQIDGSGYPQKQQGDMISTQSRMISIADIYDALTSSDRPYKKSISAEDAIGILRALAKSGKIDTDLLEIFINEKCYLI